MDISEDKLVHVFKDDEGYYRWTYTVTGQNSSLLKTYMIIFAACVLVPGFILFFMIYGRNLSRGYWDGAMQFLGILAAIFLAAELLTIAIYKLFEKSSGGTDLPYAMAEDHIIVHPGNRNVPRSYLQTDFSQVKSVRLDRDSDLILLNELMRVTHVYVPHEDLPFVLNFILERVPQTDQISALQQKAKDMLNKKNR